MRIRGAGRTPNFRTLPVFQPTPSATASCATSPRHHDECKDRRLPMTDVQPIAAVGPAAAGGCRRRDTTLSGNRGATIACRKADVVDVEQLPRHAPHEAGAWRGGEGVVFIRFVVRNLRQVLATWMRPSGLQARFYAVQLHGTGIFVPPELTDALCSGLVLDVDEVVLTNPELAADDLGKPIVGFYTHRMLLALSPEEAIQFAIKAVLDDWRSDPLYQRCNMGRFRDLAVEETFRPRVWSALCCANGGYTFYT